MYRNRLGEQLGNWRSGSSLDAEAVEEAIDEMSYPAGWS